MFKEIFRVSRSIKFIDNTNQDGRKIENHKIEFVISLKKQGKGFAAISNYVASICKYYRKNDVVLNTNKIHLYLQELRKSKIGPIYI